MEPTPSRAQLCGRGFLFIAALLVAQLFAAPNALASATGCPCSFWSASVYTGDEAPDPSPVNLGIRFTSDTAGYIKAIRFYKHPDNTGPHTAYLWTDTGAQLASATFANETATGWQEVQLTPAVAITANTVYVASYFTPGSHWAHNMNYFNEFGTDSGPLHIVGGAGNNSRFTYASTGVFPTGFETDHSANYFVDVVFDTVASANTTAPTATVTPANGATGADPNANVTIAFSKEMDATTINDTNVQLLNASNVSIGSVSYPDVASKKTATIVPASVLALSTTYTVRIKGGAGGVKDISGNALASDVVTTFTTAAAMPTYSCPCSIWSAADSGAESADLAEVTLGVKFASDADGYIKGIRFYKTTGNTGTHYGYLWTSSGQMLAKATFTNETASGWQEVRFLTPVAVSRHTTYVAGYYLPVGHWANTRPYFQTGPFFKMPLRALQNFTQNMTQPNGVYIYGAPDQFPSTDPLDAPNYWIDVVFDTSASDTPSFTSAAAMTFNVGTPGTFTVSTTGNPAPAITETGALPVGVTFVDNGDHTGTLAGTPAASSGGVYPITFTATNSSGTATQNFTITVNQPPAITVAATDQSVCAGATVSFTAAASGFPTPSQQWQVSTDGGATFTNILNATSSTYSVTTTAADNNKRYRALFTNSGGTAATTATLTVTSAPVANINPASQAVCAGSTATFNALDGATSAIQWQVSTDNGGSFTDIAGATSATYSFTTAAPDNGKQYRARFTNSCGTATSSAATLTVATPAVVATNPANQNVCAGNAATFTASATGSPAPSVQWQVSADNGATFANIAGATSTTYSFTPALAESGRQYRAVFTNACGSVNTTAATLTVSTLATPAITPSPSQACAGSTGNTATGPAAATTYAWSIANGTIVSGQNAQTVTYTAGASGTVDLTLTVTNAAGCSASNTTSVPVVPQPATPAATNGGPYCAGATIALSTAPVSGATYSWTGPNGFTSAAQNPTIANATTANSGTYSVTVTANGCTSAAGTTVVTVNAAPAPPSISAPAVVNSSSSGNQATTAATASTYAWSIANGTITSATNLQTITFTAGASGTVTLTLTITNSSSCTATSSTTVPINHPPLASNDAYDVVQNSTLTQAAPGVLANDSDAENTALTAVLVASPAHGNVTVNPNGSFTYVPQTNYVGDDAFTYQASDGTASSNTATVTINVLLNGTTANVGSGGNVTTDVSGSGATDAQPVQTTVTMPAGVSGTVSIATGVTDPSAVPPSGYTYLNYEVTISAPVATAANPLVLAFRIDASIVPPGQNEQTLQIFRDGVAVPDCSASAGTTATPDPCVATRSTVGNDIALTVRTSHASVWNFGRSTQNTAAVAANDAYSTCQDVPLSLSKQSGVLANDTDADHNTLTAVLITAPAHASAFTLHPDGSFDYTPASGYNGADSFTYAANDGTVDSNPATVAITVNGTPATPTISGASSFCPGGSATLTSSSATGNQWYLDGTALPNASSQTYTATTGGNYTVVVTTSGCASAPSAPFSVAANTVPAAPAASNGGPYCGGSTVSLSTPAVTGATYTWTGPNNFTSNQQNPTIANATAAASGTYSVTITVNGCTSAPGTTNVVVNPAPATPAASNSGPYCEGATVSLSTPAVTGATYTWTGPNNFTSSQQNPTIANATVAASGTYSVTITVNGCTSAAGTTTVVVNASPAPPAITASGPTTFCAGGSVTLTAAASATYLWSNGATTQSITVSASGNYSVTVTNASGCSATSAATPVTVNPLPAATITASGPTTFCAGGSVTLTASAGSSYSWSNGATTQSITVTASGSYTVTVTNASGCSATSAATPVTVNALPAATITASGSTTFCQGGSVALTASAGSTYLWSNGATTQSITVNASGNYSVTVTNASGCSATSAATAVTVNALPATPAITPAGPVAFCAGGSVTLTSSSATGNQWYLNSGAIAGATAATYNATASGTYTVVVTTSGCASAPSAGVSVTVNPIPQAPTITAGGPTTFCQGGSVTLTSSALAGNQWYLNNAPIAGATDPQYSATSSGSYTVVTTLNGCPSPASAATNVTVNPTPAAPVITAPSSVNPDSTGNTASGPAGATTYAWSIVNGTITSATNTQSITYTAGAFASLTLNLTVTNASGCTASSSLDVNIATNQPPVANNDTYATTTNTPVSGNVLTNDTDLEGDPKIAVLTANASNGTLSLNSDGSFTYTPATNWNGTDTFKYKARDAGAMSTSDDTLADFQAGSVGSCTATTLGNGDVMLAPAAAGMLQTFSGTSLPVGWSAGGTTPSVSGGMLVLNGGTLEYSTAIAVPAAGQVKSLEFVATFLAAPNQQAGLGSGGAGNVLTSGSYWAMFSTGSTGDQLYVRTNNNATDVRTALGAGLLGSPHTFRVEWTSGSVTYYVDNVAKGTQTFTPAGTGNAKIFVAANDDTADASSLNVDWMRLGPYSAPCTFTSRVHDADGTTWKTLTATTSLPNTATNSTNITFETRTGTTASPDASWSGWTAVSGTTISSPAGRYLQYRANLSTTDGNTPTLQKVLLTADPPLSNEATVTIAVRPPNVAPVAVNDSYATCQNTLLAVNAPGVLSNDTDGDNNPLNAVIATPPAHAASFVLNANGSFTYTPAAGYSGPDSFTYYANDGTTNSNTVATVNIIVNATPATPSASNGGPYCEGATISLTTPAVGGATYAWSGPNGFTSTQQNPTIANATTAMSGTYSVTVTVNGCVSAPGTTALVVNAIPATPAITAGGPTTFCAGGSVTLTSSAGGSYLWSNGATTQSINVTESGNYTVVVTTNGCSSAPSAAVAVTVNALPATPVITASGPTTFCAGGSVTLTAPAAATYLWSNGATTQSITVNASGNYSVTVTNASGCTATSAATAVTVVPLPVATISAGGPTTFCAGGSVTLTASAGTSYLWSNGATTQSIVATQSGNYTVTVTDASGCSATSAATPVTVNPLPAATITASGPTTFCEGGNVTLTASAGSSYSWSNGATTQSITVNASGNYTVTVTDASGCSNTSPVTVVTVNPLPAATITASGATTFCQGGSVTLTSSAGTSYLWSNGATTQSISVNASGNYTVTVTDASGCSNTSAATNVIVNAQPAATITASGSTTFCAGGSVTLTAPAAASYLWSNSATTQSITVSASGNYSVTVTNASGCSTTSAPTPVTVLPLPEATITASGATTFCAGGSVTLTGSAGSSYLWSNGATTQSINVNASGSYTVTVTDAAGCSNTSAATNVTVNPLPEAKITASGPLSFCQGGNVTLTASAGSSYSWSNGATTQSITVATSGSYTVTVTSVSGCSNTSAVTMVTVNPPPAATITASGSTTFCQGGSVTLTASAGTSYLWSNGATTQSIVATQSGNYTVTVTDASGCSNTSAATNVTVNAQPAATITPSGPTTFCAGGSVTLTASAGSSYAWSNGATTQSITVNASGSYSVTVTSGSGCTATSASTPVTVNAPPAASISTATVVNANSTGNTASGPAGMSAYAWSVTNGTITSGATAQTMTFTAGSSGSVVLNLTVTNSASCQASSSAIVPVNHPPVARDDAFTTVQNTALHPTTGVLANDTDADGDALTAQVLATPSHGTLSLNADGTFTYTPAASFYGSDSFTYRASDAVAVSNTATVTIQVYQSLLTGTAVAGGTVTTDPQSLGANATAPVQTSVQLPANDTGAVSIATGLTQASDTPPGGYSFFDWEVDVTAPSETAAAPLVMTFRLDSSIVPFGQNQNTVQVFRDGVVIADCSAGAGSSATPDPCVASRALVGDDISLTIRTSHASHWNFGRTLVNAAPVAAADAYSICQAAGLSIAAPGVLANDTDADRNTIRAVLVSGPSHAAAFTLNADGSFTYTPASAFSGTDSFAYKVNDGTTDSSAATVTITVNSAPAIPVASNGGPYCAGVGTITLSTPAVAGATYAWAGPNGFTSNLQNPTLPAIAANAGTYSLTISTNGCTSAPGTTTVVVNATPATPTITAGATTFCAGGSVTLTSSSSTGNQWYRDGVAVGTGNTLVATQSGNYTVVVTSNGCSSAPSTATTVTVTPLPSTPTITAGGPTTFCAGGSVTLTSSSGTGNQWYRDGVAVGTSNTFVATQSGTYTVVVTSNGCSSAPSAATVVTVTPLPATPTTSATGSTTFCEGGSVTLTSSSASGNQWYRDGVAVGTSNTFVATQAGNYTVVVTSNGCSSAPSTATTVTVSSLPPAPTITAGGPTTFCAGGSVTLTSSPASSYLWSNGATTQAITVTATGSYSVSVSNASGCTATSAATPVTVTPLPATPTVTANGPTTFCAGGSVTLTSSAASSYLWSNGATTQSITVLASGSYSVTVTNASGCTATSAATPVTVNPLPSTPTITAGGPTTFCAGGSVTLTSTAASSYLWSTGATTQSITVSATGSYSVTVTNASGCTATSAATPVTVNPAPSAPTISVSGATTFCAGGSVTLTSSSASGNQWYLNGSPISAANASTYAATVSGDYTVAVTSSGCASAPSAAVTVTVNPAPAAPAITAPASVMTASTGNTASAPAGMSAYSWTITGGTITAGATSQTVTFTAGAAGTLTLSLTVTNASGCTASNSANVPVYAQPTISIDSPTQKAPAKGATAPMVFTLTLSNPSSQVVTVAYGTSNGTAIAGTDYLTASGTVTFPAGSTSQTISVTLKGTGATTTKTFWVNLSSPTNATIALVAGYPIRGKGTINP